LFEIVSALGTRLGLDDFTKNRTFGHYARILVDNDLSRRLFDEIMVEQDGYAFNLGVVYERLLEFCPHCQVIGHNISNCKWLHPQRNDKKEVHGKKVKTDVINKIIKKEYVAKATEHSDSAPKQQLIINKKPDIVILETAEPAAASHQFVPVLPDK
jgi:hypothetical protein